MITVVTATAVEARAARRALLGMPGVRVLQAGIALARVPQRIEGTAISCGIAGGLRVDLPTGTVLIPSSVRRPDGTHALCDSDLVERLRAAARGLDLHAVDAPLLTIGTLVLGSERTRWAAQGYAGVDMESGLIHADRFACVRVVLDTPQREISPAWLHPRRVLFHLRAWRDLPFLAREGPRCARLAAGIVAQALGKAAD